MKYNQIEIIQTLNITFPHPDCTTVFLLQHTDYQLTVAQMEVKPISWINRQGDLQSQDFN